MIMAKAKPKQKDPTKPFPAPNDKKKASAKIDMMLMKAMPGIGMKTAKKAKGKKSC